MNRKQQMAAALWELAGLEHASSSRRSFRARAYRQATWALDHLSSDLDEAEREILAVPGIGRGVAALIEEFRHSGSIRRLSALRAELPASAAGMSELPRMTPARLRDLAHHLRIETTDDLLAAIEAGAVAALPRVGDGTAAVWRDRLLWRAESGTPIQRAAGNAGMLADHLERHVPGASVRITGAVRRLDETVDALELLAVGGRGLRRFLRQSAVVTRYGAVDGHLRMNTLVGPAIVHESRPGRAGGALVATTGPPDHVERLEAMSGSARLAWTARTEEDLYRSLGEDVPPPPARQGEFPPSGDLVRSSDVRGDLHLHTDWSRDGRQTLEALVEGARARNLEYIAVTDHAADLGFGGLTSEDLCRQKDAILAVRDANPDITILHGAELNIGRDGSVDYDDEVLSTLDFRLAAVHSHFDLTERDQTERILRVVTHPLIHAVAHLTGRRIGIRPPIQIDLDDIIAAAVEHGTALEVNGHLDRLDLSTEHARRAVSGGALLAADSDAHRVSELDNTGNAIGVLQRAGAPAGLVVNTWPVHRLLEWLGGE